ncbi:MAG: PIG-L family deacetylase [Salinibacterium sp.]|nr:PIG-L family deacetylase [Cryobacterium sp.]MCB1281238.1 PIG-L family deacetylase [Salinibacterium sp.]
MRILSTVRVPESREHVLFVHAHPDDETISTGGTMATLIDSGAEVTLVTCTRGERGEVIPPELQHLSGDALGAFRETELAAAMAELHLGDYRFLGDDGARALHTPPHRYRDSGMQWGEDGAQPLTESGDGPDARDTLTGVELDAVVADILAVAEEVHPTAIVSYDERGGYGHPDHVRAHEAARTAALLADVPFFAIVGDGRERPGDIRIDVEPVLERKKRALRAHRTQLTVEGETIVHSGGQVEPIGRSELFRPQRGPASNGIAWARFGITGRIAVSVIAVLLGVIVGTIGTANNQAVWVAIPLGIVALFLVGLRLLFTSRVAAGFAAIGLVGAVWLLSQTGPGGSVLVPATTSGYLWTFGTILIAVVVLAWPRRGKVSRATMGTSSKPGKDVGTP